MVYIDDPHPLQAGSGERGLKKGTSLSSYTEISRYPSIAVEFMKITESLGFE
jgi:hypothetical protein